MECLIYSEKYRQQVIKTLDLCFPKNNITEKSFEWKHMDPSFKNKQLGYFLMEGDVVTCFVCFTPVLLSKPGGSTECIYSCAIQATHPNYRRQGLVTKLTKAVEEQLGQGINYVGFSNQEGVKIDKHSKSINYTILGEMVKRYCINFPQLLFKKFKFEPITIDKLLHDIENIASIEYFSIHKDKTYLDWRYKRHPKHTYSYFAVLQDRDCFGFIICKDKLLRYEITEIICAQQGKILEIFKEFSSYSLKKSKIITSIAYLPNRLWNKHLPLAVIRNFGIYFTVKSTEEGYLDPNSWLVQGGDVQ